jgi:hypothetical protein
MNMSWQDIILSVGNLLLGIALIPSIISSHKPALLTSLLQGCILLTFGIVYASLGLWVSVGAISLSVVLWFVLVVQKYRQEHDSKKSSV